MGAVAVSEAFPVDVLEDCSTALVVFAAAFGGAQDAAYIRAAGMTGTCLDNDPDALLAMTGDYPDDWVFVCADAFNELDHEAPRFWPGEFDVVTLDPFTGGMMDKTIERLADFCKLARKYVIVGTDSRKITPPAGWRIRSKMLRSRNAGGIFWTVLERAC